MYNIIFGRERAKESNERRPTVTFCTLVTSRFKSNIIAIIGILEKRDVSINARIKRYLTIPIIIRNNS